MTTDVDVLLKGIPAFSELSPESLEELENSITRRRARAGEYLFRQGEGPPPNVFYLISATAEVLAGPTKEEHAVSLSRPGQLVGWLTVFTSDPFPASARVVKAGELIQIPAELVRTLMDRHPAVGQVLATTMAKRVGDLFQEIRNRGAQTPLNRAETFLFRKKVSEVMTSPVLALPPDATAREAAVAMGQARASSVVVMGEGAPMGIVTEKDLVQRVLSREVDPDQIRLDQVMSAPVATLPPQEYLYKALGTMRSRHLRHLPVVDGERLVGILSTRDLMSMGVNDTLELAEQIHSAGSLDLLHRAYRNTHAMCVSLLQEGMPAEEVSQLLSHINRDIHRRVLEICLAGMESEGLGQPPVPFCFIVMGSHGRGENHMHTDQDHGMILADYPPEEWARVEPFFMELSGRVSEGLAVVGFSLCQGNVMSSNPVWRKAMREWKAQVEGWYRDSTSNAVRYTTLFYDFLPIWGDVGLARELRDYITEGIQRNATLLRSLFEEASHHKVPLTFFKNFVTERAGPHKGQLDIKKSGLLFVVECARILSLRHGIPATGTVERLEALAAKGVAAREEVEFIQTAYKSLFHFLLNAQARRFQAGEAVDNYVDPQSLPIQERYLLRHALEATGRLQGLVNASFGNLFY